MAQVGYHPVGTCPWDYGSIPSTAPRRVIDTMSTSSRCSRKAINLKGACTASCFCPATPKSSALQLWFFSCRHLRVYPSASPRSRAAQTEACSPLAVRMSALAGCPHRSSWLNRLGGGGVVVSSRWVAIAPPAASTPMGRGVASNSS